MKKYAKKLSDVMERIREYKPEANAYLAMDDLYLLSDDQFKYDTIEKQNIVIAMVSMDGFDGGDW